MTLSWPLPALQRARHAGLTAASWLVVAAMLTVAPVSAFWVGSQMQASGSPSMGSIVAVVGVLAAVEFALVALLRSLAHARDRVPASVVADGTRVPWLHGKPIVGRNAVATVRPHAVAAARFARSAVVAREPLVLVDGDTGTTRPWDLVRVHLEFGFDVLAAVLPRDGSLDGTLRAMDRAGWQTAHVVARPCDAGAAVDLARLGRARSLLILAEDAIADDVVVATEIAEFAAFRRS